jgi:hypothetical protein
VTTEPESEPLEGLFGDRIALTITFDRTNGDFDVNWDGMSQVEAIGLLTLALREAELPIYEEEEEL